MQKRNYRIFVTYSCLLLLILQKNTIVFRITLFIIIFVSKIWRIQRANALRRKVIKSFRKNTQKEYKNLIFLLVED